MGANFSDLGLVNWHRLIPDPAIRARTLVVLDVEFPDSYGFNAVCAPVQIERARTHSQPTNENEPTSARGSNPMFRARSGACEEIASMPSQTAL